MHKTVTATQILTIADYWIFEKKEAIEMGVKSVGERYRCSVCGNEVTVTKVGGGTLVCCGKPMVLVSK